MKLGAQGIPTYRTFVVHEVKEATNNFHESNHLGDGSNWQVYILLVLRFMLVLIIQIYLFAN